ncbi:hypothetical protein CSOJ01_01517 [Colletotrichum sojae]|uniref:Uncharacterized protein n=1 Tax=Colletotrichum sojae TaxID=2175907 RepID=A0A8H6JTJ4_9PEZI|nr:hypothetical protein CSOJ01_01517 [Colletotrichum sojae]
MKAAVESHQAVSFDPLHAWVRATARLSRLGLPASSTYFDGQIQPGRTWWPRTCYVPSLIVDGISEMSISPNVPEDRGMGHWLRRFRGAIPVVRTADIHPARRLVTGSWMKRWSPVGHNGVIVTVEDS